MQGAMQEVAVRQWSGVLVALHALEDIETIKRLQRMYGYYIDNRLWGRGFGPYHYRHPIADKAVLNIASIDHPMGG